MECPIDGLEYRLEWWNGLLDGTFLCVQQMAPFSMCSSYSFFRPFLLCQTSGGGMDASQYKAELTIGRLVSKQPLSRVWHYSETMFLYDSPFHCSSSFLLGDRHRLFQYLSMKLKNQSFLCQQ